jgi:predicted kinase
MTNGKLLIFRGLPGSGKSTQAKSLVATDPESFIRVNRDDLRKMMHDGVYVKGSPINPGTEQSIINAELALVRRGLRAGLTVIDDNTNLPSRSVKQLVEIAETLGVPWEIVDFTDVPVNTCVDRDETRQARVGEAVIYDLHSKFVKGKPYPLPFEYNPKPEIRMDRYVPDITKPRAIIVDIDGTVALMNGKRTPHEYDKVSLDDPNWPVITVVQELSATHRVLFTSGRKDSCWDDTADWLSTYFPYIDYELLMRKHDDNRPDNVVKLEIFNQSIRDNFNVKMVFDDRDQVVKMWRGLGLTCLQVAEGNF